MAANCNVKLEFKLVILWSHQLHDYRLFSKSTVQNQLNLLEPTITPLTNTQTLSYLNVWNVHYYILGKKEHTKE